MDTRLSLVKDTGVQRAGRVRARGRVSIFGLDSLLVGICLPDLRETWLNQKGMIVYG